MIIAIVIALATVFSFVVFFGAPYLPTLKKQIDPALDLLDLKPGQTLIELGSGDGRVMRSAARRGLNVIGYEINPILVLISYAITFKYRKQVKIVWANFWRKDLPRADGVFVFLIDRFMPKLDKKMQSYDHKPIKILSFAFTIPGKKPERVVNGLNLYKYR